MAAVLLSAGVGKLVWPDPVQAPALGWLVGIGDVGGAITLYRVVGAAEILLAIGLLTPATKWVSLQAAVVLLGGFAIYHIVTMISGGSPRRSCGCFGQRLRVHDSIVMALTGAMLLAALMARSMEPERSKDVRSQG